MAAAGGIPKIIHQTWKTDEIPSNWQKYVQSWKDLHPAWEYRLWTDEANREFVSRHYPDFLAKYDDYPYAIQRADAVRYCLLHHYGGVYIDMDIECLKPLDDLIAGHEFVAVPEPDKQAQELKRERVLSNAFMASKPGHRYLEAIISAMMANPRRGITNADVLEITGPLMMSNSFESYTGGDVSVMHSRVAFPFPAYSNESHMIEKRWPGHEAIRREAVESGTYAIHYWANSWVASLAGELINPTPHDIEGFDFFPGLDSPGNDIANVGRDIRLAAIACQELSTGIAFNTDGFVKDRLLPRKRWHPIGGGASDQGIYLKKKRGFWRLLPSWPRRR